MANPARGEVALPLGDKTLTIALTLNSICEIEEFYELGISEVAAKLEGARVRDILTFLHFTVKKHHPEMTEAELGDMIQAQDIADIGPAITSLFDRGMPDSSDSGKKENPRKRGSTRSRG